MNVEELWERFYPERPATRADNNLQVHRLPLHRLSRRARPLPTLPHAAASSPTAEPAAQLGGADCLAGFPLSGQPVANLHHLRQRRAGRHDPLGDHLPGQQQYRHCRGRVYRQYFGAIHQSYSVIYPAAQHTIQVRAGIAHPHPAAAANHRIGRWSMLDLFVISLTMSLINRDQLLAFTMGPAAVYFGGAVILTILAVEWLDSRLLWDAHESGNARFAD